MELKNLYKKNIEKSIDNGIYVNSLNQSSCVSS